MNEAEMTAFRALAECIAATGGALAKLMRVVSEEFPQLKPEVVTVMDDLVRELSTAALLLPE